MHGNRASKSFDYVIIGAGVAGLTLAHQLLEAGRSVLLIERHQRVGGLAKSFLYEIEGKTCIFDTGPKRFHTEDPQVREFIARVLEGQYLEIGRQSSVYLFGRYFNWPLSTKDLFKLPLSVQLRVGYDLMRKLVNGYETSNDHRFQSYILNQYGPTLYHSFFKGYTEKFIGIPATEVHEDWATTGINRSIIDKKAKGNSIFELARSVLLPPTLNTIFLYPKVRGFGNFCERLATVITAMGGTILTGTTVDGINSITKTIRFNDDYAGFSCLVWTGNLHDLGRLLGEKFSHLEYLSTIFYNIVLRSRPRRKDQWIYYGDCDLHIVRVSIVNNFAPYLVPEPWGGLIVEKTCRYQDKIWNNPASLQSVIIDELMRVGLISSASDLLSTMVEPVRDTYPVYHLNYRKGFSQIMATVTKRHPYITLLGRTGAFWYNNSDHSISLALRTARYLTGKETREPDKENIFSSGGH